MRVAKSHDLSCLCNSENPAEPGPLNNPPFHFKNWSLINCCKISLVAFKSRVSSKDIVVGDIVVGLSFSMDAKAFNITWAIASRFQSKHHSHLDVSCHLFLSTIVIVGHLAQGIPCQSQLRRSHASSASPSLHLPFIQHPHLGVLLHLCSLLLLSQLEWDTNGQFGGSCWFSTSGAQPWAP